MTNARLLQTPTDPNLISEIVAKPYSVYTFHSDSYMAIMMRDDYYLEMRQVLLAFRKNLLSTSYQSITSDLIDKHLENMAEALVTSNEQKIKDSIKQLEKLIPEQQDAVNVLANLKRIKEQAHKILRKYEEIFDDAIKILRSDQPGLVQTPSDDEQKPIPAMNARAVLIAALEAFKQALTHEIDNKISPKFLALSAENLATQLMDPKATPDTKTKAIIDFQYSVSQYNNTRIVLAVLGALIVGAALGATLAFCPLVGLAALLALQQQILGTIVFSLVGLYAGLWATDTLDGTRRLNLFFTKPIVTNPDITASVVNAATAMAKTPEMKA
jgi:hypothetical protein